MAAPLEPELDIHLCAIKTRLKPNWEKGLARLRELKDRPFEQWPFAVESTVVDADWPGDPFAELTATIEQMRNAWDHAEEHGTRHFQRINHVGKRHVLVAGGVQMRERQADGALKPLEHSPEVNSLIWIKALGIDELMGFDPDPVPVLSAEEDDAEDEAGDSESADA